MGLHGEHLNYKCFQPRGEAELSTGVCFSHQQKTEEGETGTAVCSYVQVSSPSPTPPPRLPHLPAYPTSP